MDYPLNILDEIEADVEETVEEAKAKSEKPMMKTRSGYCCDIVIGRKLIMALRD